METTKVSFDRLLDRGDVVHLYNAKRKDEIPPFAIKKFLVVLIKVLST